MLAADTSSLVAYLAGASGDDVNQIEAALLAGTLALPPVVLTELLSDPKNGASLEALLSNCLVLEVQPGYWERAGASRAAFLAKKLRAKIPDVLIAQSCLDHGVALITRDTDFRHFAKHCDLKLP